eukprot:11835527-Alexandrium_andersonii.AAC.1
MLQRDMPLPTTEDITEHALSRTLWVILTVVVTVPIAQATALVVLVGSSMAACLFVILGHDLLMHPFHCKNHSHASGEHCIPRAHARHPQ